MGLPLAKPLIDPDFDAGSELVTFFLCEQIRTRGAIALHPDANTNTTYDPVPLIGDNERSRAEHPSVTQKRKEEEERWERYRQEGLRRWRLPAPPPHPALDILPPAVREQLPQPQPKLGGLALEMWLIENFSAEEIGRMSVKQLLALMVQRTVMQPREN